MNAVFLDFGTLAADELDTAPLCDPLPGLRCFDHSPAATVSARLADAEVAFINKVRLDADTFAASPQLRYVGLAATGSDNVDLDAARRAGVTVTNIRGYCTQSVVEYVVGTLITLAHGINHYRDDVRQGRWQTARQFCLLDHPLRELSAMTLGIVGHGVLGQAVADAARSFGMRVLIAERPRAQRCREGRVPFDEMLEQVDALTLHCPLTPDTQHLLGVNELSRMKPNVLIVNTARGGLIDSTALVSALASGRVAGAAVDVLDHEPPVNGEPLLDYEGRNLILTPHIAWASATARQNAINQLGTNLQAWLGGQPVNQLA